jgi:small conductance mechanosensitive channel
MTPLALTAVRALAVFTGVVVILERLGVNVGPILAGAGILGLGVGMGAQSLVKDVINGISILMMDTLSVGDYVTIGGRSGTVETVGLRTIRLRDAAGNLTVVPNSSVDTIVNMTRDYSQDLIEFTVPYDANPDDMLKLAGEVARSLSDDRDWQRYLMSPVDLMGVTAFDANGTTIRLKINTTAGNQWTVGRELRLRLKRKMLEAGYTSPWFGQSVFVLPGDSKYAAPRKNPGENNGPDDNGQ